MIPIHDIAEQEKKEIRMNELMTLTHYDSSEAHRHHYLEFFVFLKGGGTHLIDFIEFPIEDFSIHIVAPRQVHQVKRSLDSNGFVFLFEMSTFDQSTSIDQFLLDHECLSVMENQPNYRFLPEFHHQLRYLVEQAWKDYQSEHPLKNQFVLHHLSLLILHCLGLKKTTNDQQDAKNADIYSAFRRLLSKQYKEVKKVKDFAKLLHISEKQLNEITQQRSGETASSLIYKQIILEAKRLLNTGISTKETAYELNFMDPAHFSKFFKSQTGLSPSEFAKIHASGGNVH